LAANYDDRARVAVGKIDPTETTSIEFQTIREFRRRTREPQHHRVHEDTLFCLSLMQHHGAPTRLLDCTYSPFAAAAFAMEKGYVCTKPVVWCFRANWFEEEVKKAIRDSVELLEHRETVEEYNDASFIVRDTTGRQAAAKLLSKDEARRMAVNIAKLPNCCGVPNRSTSVLREDYRRHPQCAQSCDRKPNR
jgi:hypothetical protein